MMVGMEIDTLYWIAGRCLDYCQRIEHDVLLLLELLSASRGIPLSPTERRTLGESIHQLQEIDRDCYLSANDYRLLKGLRNRRNRLVHETFNDFRYAGEKEVERSFSVSALFAQDFLEDLEKLWKAIEDARITAYRTISGGGK